MAALIAAHGVTWYWFVPQDFLHGVHLGQCSRHACVLKSMTCGYVQQKSVPRHLGGIPQCSSVTLLRYVPAAPAPRSYSIVPWLARHAQHRGVGVVEAEFAVALRDFRGGARVGGVGGACLRRKANDAQWENGLCSHPGPILKQDKH